MSNKFRGLMASIAGGGKRRHKSKNGERFTEQGTARVYVRPNGARYVRPKDLVESPKFRESINRMKELNILPNNQETN